MKQISWLRMLWIIAGLGIFISSALAQTTNEGWEALIRPGWGNLLYVVGADGVRERIELPDLTAGQDMIVSPSRRYIVFRPGFGTDPANYLILDRQAEVCCQPVQDVAFNSDSATRLADIMAFDPDETQLVIRYSYIVENCEICWPEDRYAIFDLASDEITFDVGSEPFRAWQREPQPRTRDIIARPGDSPDAYLMTRGQVWLGDRHIERLMSVVAYNGLYDAGSTLANGEHIVYGFFTNEDTNPGGGVLGGFITPVIYYQDTEGNTDIIFQDTNRVYNNRHGAINERPPGPPLMWVADGDYLLAFYIAASEAHYGWKTMLIARDGSQTDLDLPADEQPLFGTPAGWVSLRRAEDVYQLVHYVQGETDWEARVISEEAVNPLQSPTVMVYQRPILGDAAAAAQPLPAIIPEEMGTVG